MYRQDFALTLKELSGEGTFTGWASTYHNTDRTGDVILPGAFSKSIAKRPEVPILWRHSEPIGVGRLQDHTDGLIVNGRLTMAVSLAKEALALMKDGAVKGLSIGYSLPVDGAQMRGDVRVLSAVELFEVSLTAVPANESARITSVKSAADLLTVRDFESWLHQSGFSKAKAAALASRGWKAASEEDEDDPAELLAWLRAQQRG